MERVGQHRSKRLHQVVASLRLQLRPRFVEEVGDAN